MKKIKVGAAFSESIYTEKPSLLKSKRVAYGEEQPIKTRTFLLPIIFIACLALLVGRLFYLQIINGQKYRMLSDTNRTRTTTVFAPRGIIFDRNGKPLVFNTPGFRKIINGKAELIDEKTGISLLARGDRTIKIDSLRSYPFQESMAHILGYIGQISQEELSDPQFANYSVGDIIGKMGIEQEYEKLLRGVNGERLEEVNATGKPVRTLGQTDPFAGQNITLTIDSTLQQVAYDAIKGEKKGAVIVTKPDGEILAMVSQPAFDPNVFTMGEHYIATNSAYPTISSVLMDGNNEPLLNRAIGGTYPPGSTFKLVVAATGLETKKIDTNYTIEDTGILKVGAFSFSNWYYSEYGKTEGTVNVVTAIKRSNDIFFYKLAERLGVDTISQEAEKFNIGTPLGIDLEGERKGLVPTKEWKQKTLGEQWYLGDDYQYGIGQGYLLTTPLQVNAWTQAIANNGTLYQPRLLKNTTNKPIRKDFLRTDTIDVIKQGMIEACNTGGVAWPLFNFNVKREALNGKNIQIDGKDFFTMPDASGSAQQNIKNNIGISVACKTGTAQHGGEDTLPHAWITLFAPAYKPQVVVTVLVESSGEGSNIAAPIAKKVLEAYFEEKN